MKILYDYQIFYDQEYGGPSRYFFNLAKKLIKKEDLKICAPIHINNYLNYLPKKNVYGVKINNNLAKKIPFKIKTPFNKYFIETLNKILTNHFIKNYKPDIIHQTFFNSLKKTDTATVLTIHDLIHEKFHAEYNRDSNYKPKQKAIENADQIICVSKSTYIDLIKYYDVSKKKIKVIYHGYDFNFSDKYFSEKKSIEINKSYLLYVGKRKGYKNFVSFLKMYSLSNKLKKDFNIVCFGGGPLQKDEIKLIDNLNIKQNIFQIFGDDEKLSFLYKNARALIYPSKYEGFGLPVLEAMASNCPVICSNSSSLPEVGGDSVQYFDPYNQDEMNDVINTTIYSDTKLEELKKRGVLQSKLFSWDKCSSETLNTYKDLLC